MNSEKLHANASSPGRQLAEPIRQTKQRSTFLGRCLTTSGRRKYDRHATHNFQASLTVPRKGRGQIHQSLISRDNSTARLISNQKRPRIAAHATEGHSEGDTYCNQEAAKLLKALQQQPQIGSEYGEGFTQLRSTGTSLHLDVDTLNEKLKLKGAERLRTAMCPDEAFGMIFSWDGVLADMHQVLEQAWGKLAEQEGFPSPCHRPQIFNVPPERAIIDVLGWTKDWGTAQRMAFELANTVASDFKTLQEPLPGVLDWLAALKSVNVTCALTSSLDRMSLHAALQRMGLQNYFTVTVCAEDGMETTSQQFLSAAIKLGRPPKDCVVFESSPVGITAAHNCSCKVVAVQGCHPAYQLKQADLTCSSLSELSVYNIRRLFANRGSDFMDKKKAFVPNWGNNDKPFWKVANGVVEP